LRSEVEEGEEEGSSGGRQTGQASERGFKKKSVGGVVKWEKKPERRGLAAQTSLLITAAAEFQTLAT
jgi:hypothetical protein